MAKQFVSFKLFYSLKYVIFYCPTFTRNMQQQLRFILISNINISTICSLHSLFFCKAIVFYTIGSGNILHGNKIFHAESKLIFIH